MHLAKAGVGREMGWFLEEMTSLMEVFQAKNWGKDAKRTVMHK